MIVKKLVLPFLYEEKRNLTNCNYLLFSNASFYMKWTYNFLTGNENRCSWKIKKRSTHNMEVIWKPAMTGKHALEIRVLNRVVVYKEIESKPGKYFINVVTYTCILYRYLYILERSIELYLIQALRNCECIKVIM